MRTVCAPGLLTRLARRHGLTRSPLRRTTDRIEAAVAMVLAVLAVLVVLLGTVIAMGTYQRELTEAAADAEQQTSVTAVLLTDAQAQLASSPELGVMSATALARWKLPTEQQREGHLWVGGERRAGDRIPIWIDQQGNRVDPPETPRVLLANAAVTGIALVGGSWVLLALLWWTVCHVLGRINAAWWDGQWARTGPGWSRRSWQ